MVHQNVIAFQPKDPRERAKWHLKQNPEKVLEHVTLMRLESEDLGIWKRFTFDITSVLKQSYEQQKDKLEKEQRNSFGLALLVFSTLMKHLKDWENKDPKMDMIYPLSYLDFFYITSYLNAASDAYPKYYSFAHKYLDQVLLVMYEDFEFAVELVMEYSSNLSVYANHQNVPERGMRDE